MTEQQYQHEVIVPDKGFPFKLFLFEGHSGKYIREKHWHRSIEIFAVQEGELDFILDTTHYHLGEGEFIIVNSNEVHAIHANRPNHTIVLQIPLNQFASYFTGEQFIWFSHSERTYDEQVACLIFRMYKVYRMQTDGYDFEILSMFYQLLHILVKKYRKLDVQDELLKSNQQLNRLGMITSYLKDHYMEDISLGKLAGIFGYSPSYLSKMFARYAGINYKDYLQNIRLEHAVKDLENTDKQIVDIAFDHGFANSKAFTNLFRKRYGMLTSEYRKQLVKKKQRESYAHHRALLEKDKKVMQTDGYDFEILSMFYQLLHILVKKYRKLDVQDELLKSNQQLNRLGMITSYLKDHYMEDISLGKLAGIFGYSPSYLSKMFARYAGINYKDYLQNIRLEHAVKDLENTDKQIVDIAFDHGFANSKAFTNLFRKRYGMLTSEYRKQLVKKKQRESYAHHRALLEKDKKVTL